MMMIGENAVIGCYKVKARNIVNQADVGVRETPSKAGSCGVKNRIDPREMGFWLRNG